MTVCLFTVHMLFPAALAATSSLHSKQPECTWAIGCSKEANTQTWGCSRVAASHLPPARGPRTIGGVGHWDVGTAGGTLSRHSRERKSVCMDVAGWGEAAGAARGRIDRAAARAALSSAHGAGNA